MAWIATVPYDDANGKLKTLYDRVKGPSNNVDNIMMMHSLRPHTMEGHMAIYKYVLHHSDNTVPKWFLETLGVWVSSLNECSYCVEHHFCGLETAPEGRSQSRRYSCGYRDHGPLIRPLWTTGRRSPWNTPDN